MKVCSKCKEVKDESEFYKDKSKKDGLRPDCKVCVKKQDIQYRQKNKDKIKERKKKYCLKNKDKKRKYDEQYCQKNKDKKREYRQKNKDKRNQRAKERYQIDPQIKVRQILSSAIRRGLKKNCGSKRGSSILSKLPYSMQELKQHIENLWESWMNWENHGPYNPNRRTWQIDHIVPHSCFHYENMDCEEFRKCWALSNLRPLETIANIRKGNKSY